MAFNLKTVKEEREKERAQKFGAQDTLPDGTYTFILTGREMATSKLKEGGTKGGNPMIVLDWTVSSGQWEGAMIKDYVTFTQAAAFRINQILQAIGIGIPNQDFETGEEAREWAYGWLKIGTRIEAVTVQEPFKYADPLGVVHTRQSAKITRYQEPPGGNETPAPPSDVPDAKPEEFKHEKPADDDKPLPF